MMRSKHLWHIGFDYFDVMVPPGCILCQVSVSSDEQSMDTDINVYSIGIVLLPRTVHDSDLHDIASVLVQMFPMGAISDDVLLSYGKCYITKSMSKR